MSNRNSYLMLRKRIISKSEKKPGIVQGESLLYDAFSDLKPKAAQAVDWICQLFRRMCLVKREGDCSMSRPSVCTYLEVCGLMRVGSLNFWRQGPPSCRNLS